MDKPFLIWFLKIIGFLNSKIQQKVASFVALEGNTTTDEHEDPSET